MLHNLTITGFRTFSKLHIGNLKRVNLFVGVNNAGKTSVLEAAEILTRGTVRGLMESPSRRGERIDRELDLSHLFYGHSLKAGSRFYLEAQGATKKQVQCTIISTSSEEDDEIIPALEFHSDREERLLRISPAGGTRDPRLVAQMPGVDTKPPVSFLGVDFHDLSDLWDDIVLTPKEDQVAAALRIIEPRIERIAFLAEQHSPRGIFLKLTDSEQRLPLGSVGDGLKRLLALAIHLLSAQGGYLLVDEIDTGLHYSVMENMWKLVIETARRIDTQVLVTTHSLDCVRALAWVLEANPELAEEAALHRIEKDLSHTIEYGLDELAIAARHHVEVR